MKAVILAGGFGSRLSEETYIKPKPMVEIGGKPILWHILKIYSFYGINEFIICCGYKGNVIKEFFSNYFLYLSDITFSMVDNSMEVHEKKSEPWKITLVNTGQNTMTGGRLLKVKKYLNNESFCFTYGDGLSNVDIKKLIENHEQSNTLATVTAVQPPGRFGMLSLGKNNLVDGFIEKPQGDNSWINGGFFVLKPGIFKYLKDETTVWEQDPLFKLSKNKELSFYKHYGFWQPMDTLRDKNFLESLWLKGKAPWKVW
tara:strand:+ start:565 stop:1335 length:771 start_codon:yes stop_codon:yes gene_type:complete